MVKVDNNLWRLLACVLLSSAVTGFTSWVTFGLSRVSQADMQDYVKEKIVIQDLQTDNKILRLERKLDQILEHLKKNEK